MQRFPSMLRTIRSFSIAAALYVAITVPLPSSGQDLNEAVVLNTRVIELYNAGQYAEAIPLAQRALSIRERALGPDHPDLASLLENLAALYATQGQYVEAEALYKRSLAIREKIVGPEDPSLVPLLNDLAFVYSN